MRDDISGVGGFFEDLPVLALVLTGVAVLVASAVHLSDVVAGERVQRLLDSEAERLLNGVLSEAGACTPDLFPLASALESPNMSRCANGLPSGLEYSIGVLRLHPDPNWVFTVQSAPDSTPAATGYASSVINAVLDDGKIAIYEVRVLVWRA